MIHCILQGIGLVLPFPKVIFIALSLTKALNDCLMRTCLTTTCTRKAQVFLITALKSGTKLIGKQDYYNHCIT